MCSSVTLPTHLISFKVSVGAHHDVRTLRGGTPAGMFLVRARNKWASFSISLSYGRHLVVITRLTANCLLRGYFEPQTSEWDWECPGGKRVRTSTYEVRVLWVHKTSRTYRCYTAWWTDHNTRARRNGLVSAYVSKQFPFLIKMECLCGRSNV